MVKEKGRPLTATFVKTVTRPGRYGDGRGSQGLSLLVKESLTGRWSKTWSQRLRRSDGRPYSIGLGAFPRVTLAEARSKALENVRLIDAGQDPRAGRVSLIPTFADAAEAVVTLHAPTWRGRNADLWRASLRDHAFPTLGKMRVDAITSGDVMRTLEPIWTTKATTAQKVRQRISGIMNWAIAQGYRQDNPAGAALGAALPKGGQERQHHRAVDHSEICNVLSTVRESMAWAGTKLLAEWLALTATRSGEARSARWDEIDLEAAIWTIPAERQKSGREHRVPLSGMALEVLEQAAALRDSSGLVFPSSTGRLTGDTTLRKLFRSLDIGMVPHGFRSIFRSWCGDSGEPRELAEMALAHQIGSSVEQSYNRTDLLARRRELMERWAEYVRPG